MAENPIPSSQAIRVRLANSEAAGLASYQSQLGLTVVTDAVMLGKIADFAAQKGFAAAADTNHDAQQSALNAARNVGYTLAGMVKRFLTDLPGFGVEPNLQWQQLGFAPGTLEIPRKTVEVMLQRMAAYFTANPTKEDAERGITAAACTSAVNQIVASRAAVNATHTTYVTFKGREEAAFKALGKTMSDLVKELKLHIGNDDPRWYAFGLRRPDDPETPAAPHNLQLSSAGSGRVFADWEDVPGATRYHVWLAQGAEKAVRVASVEDSEWMGQDLIIGSEVTVFIVASNEGGESVPSESATTLVV